MCQKCLEAEKIKILKSLNHAHLFKEWAASSNEECYGIHLFGKCKSDKIVERDYVLTDDIGLFSYDYLSVSTN